MAYENEPFVKVKNGVKAPAGFHYMENGKLMSDADHIAIYGYINKKITSLDFSTSYISFLGETKSFTVRGDVGAIFSVSVKDVEAGTYYNFDTKAFQATKPPLQKIELQTSSYIFRVKFVKTGGVNSTFEIAIQAEDGHNIRTTHIDFSEANFADGSIDLNSSIGSNSKILNKVLSQTARKSCSITFAAPSLTATSADTVNGATSGSNRIIIDGDATNPNIVQVGDKVTTTGVAASVHALVTKINPDGDNTNEIEIGITDSCTNDAAITFTPPFNGATLGSNPTTYVSSGSNARIPFSISITAATGRTFSITRTPNVNDLCTFKNITFGSAALAITGENTSSASVFHRWPVTNIADLAEGMTLDPSRSGSGVNTTTPATISQYKTTKTSTEVNDGKYSTSVNEITLDDVVVSGVDAVNNDVTSVDVNGRITAQAGNIAFNVQQLDALKSDSNVKIWAYGPSQIKQMTGADISLSDITITSTQISTTTSGAVSGSATIGLAEVGNISTLQTIRGIGINSEAANPTVTVKAAASGGANITASAAQTLESGQTLFFDGASNVITVAGVLEISNMPITDITINFDAERFLVAV